jgi:hypothetical protein
VSFLLDAAFDWYVKRGLAIFPCEKKIPLIAMGFKAASKDPAQIEEWWNMWPKAQIGVPTGQVNALLVVDIDGPKGQEWLGQQNWDTTFTVQTSPGHLQLWFRQPKGVTTKCSAGQIAEEVDIRGDGGYVIGPPSFHHETKLAYTPLNFEKKCIEAPASLLALTTAHGDAPPFSPLVGGDEIPMGHRHRTMVSFAGSMRARGLSGKAILTNLRILNQQNCKPPLDDADLQRIAKDMGKKPVGFFPQPSSTSAAVIIRRMSEVETIPVEWLWPNRVPRGFLTLFVGDPGRGKSLAACSIASTVSRGGLFPDGSRAPEGAVVFLSAEDSIAHTIRPRLETANADLERVHFVETVRVHLADGSTGDSLFNLERDLEKLELALAQLSGVILVVIDPIVAFLGERIDAHKDADVRRVLSPLIKMAEKMCIGLVAIMHLRKNDSQALLRISGSIGFVATARIAWGFGKNPDDGSPCMVLIKNNFGPLEQAISYSIEDVSGIPRMKWGNAMHISPDEALSSELRNRMERGSRGSEANGWLKEILADGAVPEVRIKAKAREDGLAWRTVRRAKSALGVRSKKTALAGGWVWELSGEGGQHGGEDGQI